MFRDRRDAGHRLGQALLSHRAGDSQVLAIPRGGVVVGAEVAQALHAPLDVIIPRKIRAPGNPELAIGAVAHDGTVYLDLELCRALDVAAEYLKEETDMQRHEIERRMLMYRGSADYAAPSPEQTIFLVDDGIATGSTMIAAARATRKMGAGRLVIAIPVGPVEGVRRMQLEADEVVCLFAPPVFYAVGQFYEDFAQVDDDEVMMLLRALGSRGGGSTPWHSAVNH